MIAAKVQKSDFPADCMQFGDADSVYFESVIMKMLEMGYTISLKDLNDGGYDSTISLDDVINRVNLTPSNHIMDMMNGGLNSWLDTFLPMKEGVEIEPINEEVDRIKDLIKKVL